MQHVEIEEGNARYAHPAHSLAVPVDHELAITKPDHSAAHLLRIVLVELGIGRGDQLLQLGREDRVERRARLRDR